jgi:hypothetical protein
MLGLLHPCEVDAEGGAPRCSDVSGADITTMYPVYRPSQWQLSPDDIAGACFLYGRRDCDGGTCSDGCNAASCPDGQKCIDGGCAPAPPAACPDNGCGRTCMSGQDCAVGQSCVVNVCQDGKAEIGDPCASDLECESRLCSDGRYCARPCRNDGDCDVGSKCSSGAERSACIGAKAPLGAPCQGPQDCLGNECLSGASADPACTRECGAGHAGCPSGWQCEVVEGRSVCTLPDEAPSPSAAGCAVGTNGHGRGRPTFLGLLALMGPWTWFVARRYRFRKHRGEETNHA